MTLPLTEPLDPSKTYVLSSMMGFIYYDDVAWILETCHVHTKKWEIERLSLPDASYVFSNWSDMMEYNSCPIPYYTHCAECGIGIRSINYLCDICKDQ